MRELWNRLRDLFRRDALASELDEELRFHRGLIERDARVGGADAREAAQASSRRLGNRTTLREELRAVWGFAWLDEIARNVRYAFRGLRRSPGFVVAVVLTLGLGIGANVAMFRVIDQLMFRPYPQLRDPGTVRRVYLRWKERERERTDFVFEYTRYLDLTRWTSSFAQSAGFAARTLAVGTGDAVRERQVAMVSASFFDFFDVRPTRGRLFDVTEDRVPQGVNVALLSHAFWQAEFGGADDVVGRTLEVDNIRCVIVGVLPAGFVGVNDDWPPAVFIPITTYAGSREGQDSRDGYYTRYNWGWMEMMVRLKPGVTVTAASTALSQAYVKSWNAQRVLESSMASVAEARPRAIASSMKMSAGPDPGLEAQTTLWVGGVAVIVLLIACSNVANLFLARTLRRRRETAVRVALGVSRRRLVAQHLTESLVLSLLGGAAAVAVAQWGGAALRTKFASGQPPGALASDARTLGFTLAIAIATGLVTGIAPALLAGRGDVANTLKAGLREGTRQRMALRSALLVFQGALSLVLLVGAGLFLRSLGEVRALRLGYDAEPVIFVERNLRGMQMDDAEQIALGRRLLDAAKLIPGVEHAAWVSSVPFLTNSGTNLYVEGIESVRKLGRFTYQATTPDYFATMGTRIMRGRAFTDADRAGTPRVVVVSESMAKALWPARDPIGKCLRAGADTAPCSEVIGIAENAFQRNLTNDQALHYYLPIDQFRPNEGVGLFLKMQGDAAAWVEPVRKALQQVMPGQSFVTVRRFAAMVDGQRRSWRFGATMFAAFGLLALVVAAVGMYGVIGYDVAQRAQELAVRAALGARGADMLQLVILDGLRFAVVGIVIGGAIALASGRWVQPLLFKESARDPVVYGVVTVMLLSVALVASAVPALRASRADPNAALRAD